MSAMGRSNDAELTRALREITDDLRSFGGNLRDAANALPGVGFAANTAAKSLRTFSRDVGFGVAEDTFRFGTQYANTAFESNALRAASNIPTDPLQAGRVQRPIDEAFARLGGITGPIARAGGGMDMETKEKLANLLYDQGRRGELDSMENDWLKGKFTEKKIDANSVFAGIPGYDMLRRWFGVNVR